MVLGYISNEARLFPTFVANRVKQIRDCSTPDQWRYVDNKNNPADLASRGLNVNEMINSSLWWKGPAFLSTKDVPPIPAESIQLGSDDPEVKKVTVLATTATRDNHADVLTRLEYFSNWHKAKRAIAVCLRFKQMLLSQMPRPHKL